jgi:xanthine dehydrogenase accessory factor
MPELARPDIVNTFEYYKIVYYNNIKDIMGLANYIKDPIKIALDWDNEGKDVALATVIATWGSSPVPVGSQLVVNSSGVFEGSVSGGCIEGAVITEALEVIENHRPKRLFFGVSNERAWDVGLACGGEIEIYIERLEPNRPLYKEAMALIMDQRSFCLVTDLTNHDKVLIRPDIPYALEKLNPGMRDAVSDILHNEISVTRRIDDKSYFIHGFHPDLHLVIIGAVHIAGPLASMASLTGYNVTIIDPRSIFASKVRFPDTKLILEWPDAAMEKITLHSRTAVVALTHDPKLDDPALKTALRSNVFYIGALGSRKTHASRKERLRIEGFSEDQINRIHGPVGLDINASTPAEIAVAVLAEIIAERRKETLSDISRKTANGI